MTPVADLFPGQAAAAGMVCPQGFIHDLKALPGIAIGRMELHKLIGKGWLLFGNARQLLGRQWRCKKRVRRGFAQRGKAPCGGIFFKFLPVERKIPRQDIEQGRGEGAIIAFQLGQIGHRNAKPRGHFRLFKGSRLAEVAQPLPRKDPAF